MYKKKYMLCVCTYMHLREGKIVIGRIVVAQFPPLSHIML